MDTDKTRIKDTFSLPSVFHPCFIRAHPWLQIDFRYTLQVFHPLFSVLSVLSVLSVA